MAIIIKALGSGTYTQTGTPLDLYSVPDLKSAVVTSLRLANNNATNAVTVNVYVKPSGTASVARRIFNRDYVIGTTSATSLLQIDDPVTLGKFDKVQVDLVGGGATVGYLVSGVEGDT